MSTGIGVIPLTGPPSRPEGRSAGPAEGKEAPDAHVASSMDLAAEEQLGESGLLATTVPYKYIPAVAQKFQEIDISSTNPTSIATIKDVKYRVTNDETATTFLLGSDGPTGSPS